MLENWSPSHAIREIIANSLDEQILTDSPAIEISQGQTDYWIIRDFGRGLRQEHLTQNENHEKLTHPRLIGKFGVGLKDALATFDRHGVDVYIKSKYADFTVTRTAKHNFSDISTLHVCIAPPTCPDMVGTEFLLGNCSEKYISEAKKFFLTFTSHEALESTEFGQIISNADGASSIFINGMRVATEENFLFSYNITSVTAAIKRALNRERTNVGRSAYSDRVKSILLSSRLPQTTSALINDLKQYETGTSHDEVKWIDIAAHAVKLLNTSAEKVVFVTPGQILSNARYIEDAKRAEYQIVTISDALKDRISGAKDFDGDQIFDIEVLQEQWNQSFNFEFIGVAEMTEDELRVYAKTPKILSMIGGLPPNVSGIKISNTMRTDHAFSEAVGFWDASNRRIIIKRTQLGDIELYAGTLFHELAHAISGAPDISREFELTLTAILGRLGAHGIEHSRKDA